MIYLVSSQTSLFETDLYKRISVAEALSMIISWKHYQFDTETSGKDPHINKILCIQFGNDETDTRIVVDTTTINIQLFKNVLESIPMIGQNLKFDLQFLYSLGIIPMRVYDTMIVEQLLHLGYDKKFFRVGLNAIAMRYLGINIDKTVRGEIIWRGLDSSVIMYAAGDATYLERIKEKQLEKAKLQGSIPAVWLECGFVPVVAYLEWCGIRLDIDKWKSKMQHDEVIKEICLNSLNEFIINVSNKKKKTFTLYISHHGKEEDEIIKERSKVLKFSSRKEDKDITTSFGAFFEAYEAAVDNDIRDKYTKINNQGDLFSGFDLEPVSKVNWDSSTQVIPILKELGFNTVIQDKKTGEDKETALEKHLKGQKKICDPFLFTFFNYKAASKVCSTYGQTYIDAINPITGRIHTIYRQLGADSGRMACGAGKESNIDLAKLKLLDKNQCKYVQLQNLPSDHETREAFVSNKGNLMCSADYSALESRLGADIYNELAMIDEFLNGSGDIHSLVAKACFPEELEGITIKDIKKLRPDLRNKAKAPEFACQFGGGWMAIMQSLGCPKEEAVDIENGYYNLFQGIKRFKAEGSKKVKQLGYIEVCKYTGHKVYWENHLRWLENNERLTPDFWDRYKPIKANYLQQVEIWENLPKKTRGRKPQKPDIMEFVSKHFKEAANYDRYSLNYPTQGTGIIILKHAMTRFFKWIVENGHFGKILICNLVHDEAVIEYPEHMTEISKVLSDFMETSADVFCKALPIPVAAEVGDHWIH